MSSRAADWGMGVDEYFDIADELAMQLLEARSPEAAKKVDLVAVRMCSNCDRFHVRARLVDGHPTSVRGVGIELVDRDLRKAFTALIETLLGHVPEASGFDGRSLYEIGETVSLLLGASGINVATEIDAIGVKKEPGTETVTLRVKFKDGRELDGVGEGVPKALAALSATLAAKALQ